MQVTASVNEEYHEGSPEPDQIVLSVEENGCMRISPTAPNIGKPLNVHTLKSGYIFAIAICYRVE